jgi:hypothetical protein
MAVGRFQVMALLQAARAYTLGLPLESAKSWGLTRSIFFAAAKRGFKGKPATGTGFHGEHRRGEVKDRDVYYLGDEFAYKEEKVGKSYFVIGGKPQTEEDFKRQIESRFQGSFKQAWDEALALMKRTDKDLLLSGKDFFNLVYRPRRDELAAKWTQLSEARQSLPTNQQREVSLRAVSSGKKKPRVK